MFAMGDKRKRVRVTMVHDVEAVAANASAADDDDLYADALRRARTGEGFMYATVEPVGDLEG